MPSSALMRHTSRSWTRRRRLPSGVGFGQFRRRCRPRFPYRRDARPSRSTARKACRTVAGEVRYYAIVGADRTAQTPSGLARRRSATNGPVDEALRRDFTWEPGLAVLGGGEGRGGGGLVAITEAAARR